MCRSSLHCHVRLGKLQRVLHWQAVGGKAVAKLLPVQVRNLILSRWRSDVSRFMSEKQALAGLPKRDKPYALAAWHFLHSKCLGTASTLLLAEGNLAG